MYRAFDAVFGKVGRITYPDVVVQLVKTKCLPVLCYGIEVCPANKSDIRSLQYVVDNCFRKIFDIKLTETVEEYLKTPYAKCLHVWVIYDNCTHYVIHLHYIVSYLLLS